VSGLESWLSNSQLVERQQVSATVVDPQQQAFYPTQRSQRPSGRLPMVEAEVWADHAGQLVEAINGQLAHASQVLYQICYPDFGPRSCHWVQPGGWDGSSVNLHATW